MERALAAGKRNNLRCPAQRISCSEEMPRQTSRALHPLSGDARMMVECHFYGPACQPGWCAQWEQLPSRHWGCGGA